MKIPKSKQVHFKQHTFSRTLFDSTRTSSHTLQHEARDQQEEQRSSHTVRRSRTGSSIFKKIRRHEPCHTLRKQEEQTTRSQYLQDDGATRSSILKEHSKSSKHTKRPSRTIYHGRATTGAATPGNQYDRLHEPAHKPLSAELAQRSRIDKEQAEQANTMRRSAKEPRKSHVWRCDLHTTMNERRVRTGPSHISTSDRTRNRLNKSTTNPL